MQELCPAKGGSQWKMTPVVPIANLLGPGQNFLPSLLVIVDARTNMK